MATADLITQLNTDLGNAYDAISAKGGTVPANKNSNNLATAIETISSGGGNEPIPYFDGGEWGAIAYLEHGQTSYYTIPNEETWGLLVDSFTLINSSGDYTLLIYTDNNGQHLIRASAVLGVSIGAQVVTLPHNCLRYLPLLESVYGLDHITSVGDEVFSYCTSFDQPLTFSASLTSIGADFLSNSPSFNSAITLPEGLTSIGGGFLAEASAFSQDITIPSTVTSIGATFMVNLWDYDGTITLNTTTTPLGTPAYQLAVLTATAPTYIHGIKITGPGATTWKEAFPDENNVNSRYRKLIVV